MTNSSYHTVARKVVQRRLGKSPAKSFVQELNLQEKKSQIKCRGINYSKKNCSLEKTADDLLPKIEHVHL